MNPETLTSRGQEGLEQRRHLRAGSPVGRRLGRHQPMVAGSGEAEGGQALEDGRIPSRSASAGGDASGFASQAKRLGRAKDEPAGGSPGASRSPGPEHQGTARRGSDRTRMPSTTERDHR
ncbi:MAG: hypothetical protein M3O65_09980, partial [Actinomycetota bacterium]|nr:hypothetical protein [Actinomycetota bacterium]